MLEQVLSQDKGVETVHPDVALGREKGLYLLLMLKETFEACKEQGKHFWMQQGLCFVAYLRSL